MKTCLNFVLFIMIFYMVFLVPHIAQDAPKDELYIMHQDMVKVDKVQEYETLVKELFNLFRKFGMEESIKYASKTDDNKYNFLIPLDSYADLDKRSKHWTNFYEKAGAETVSDIFSRMDETYVSHREYIIRRSPDLSYVPAKDRLEGEKAEFVHFDHNYFKDGILDEGLKMMKKIKEMMIEKTLMMDTIYGFLTLVKCLDMSW